PKAAENRLVHSVAVANIKSQIKRNRQNERRHERNKGVRSALKTEAKKVRTSIAEGDAEAARQRLLEASRSLDQAASNGVLHKRAAARRKSRLAKAVNASTAE
ncbi:MAG: 30S ribosomal protein S20, partial [Actinomycetota bacterium]